MDIRSLRHDKLDALRLAWPDSAVHESHFAHQLSGDATYLVAWEVEQPLGSGMLQWLGPVGAHARRAFPRAVELNHLHVRREFRGQGVGSALVHAAEQRIKQEDGHQVGVAVGDDNADAHRLYARLGYLPTGVFDISEYDWVTDEGEVRHEIERDQFLVKRLDVRAAPSSMPFDH